MAIDHIQRVNLDAALAVASCRPISNALPEYVSSMADEIRELRRVLSGGCDAADGGSHVVIREGKYRFCANCGETLNARVTRYVHDMRNTSKEPSDG